MKGLNRQIFYFILFQNTNRAAGYGDAVKVGDPSPINRTKSLTDDKENDDKFVLLGVRKRERERELFI